MTVGDGIFWSTVLASSIALYLGTKDRWRWKRIVLGGVGSMLALAALVGAGVYGYTTWEQRPQVITEYWDIKLGAAPSDVIFLKGEPTKRVSNSRWEYQVERNTFVVSFDDGKVDAVLSAGDRLTMPNIGKLSTYTQADDIIRLYGPPSFVGISDDGLARSLNYDRYNFVVVYTKDGMIGGGMTATGAPQVYGTRFESLPEASINK